MNVFFMVRNQFIMASSGPVDINHVAIDAAIDREVIKDRRGCFNKVLTICGWWVKKVNSKDDDERLAQS
jgi:hypothetical protein